MRSGRSAPHGAERCRNDAPGASRYDLRSGDGQSVYEQPASRRQPGCAESERILCEVSAQSGRGHEQRANPAHQFAEPDSQLVRREAGPRSPRTGPPFRFLDLRSQVAHPGRRRRRMGVRHHHGRSALERAYPVLPPAGIPHQRVAYLRPQPAECSELHQRLRRQRKHSDRPGRIQHSGRVCQHRGQQLP